MSLLSACMMMMVNVYLTHVGQRWALTNHMVPNHHPHSHVATHMAALFVCKRSSRERCVCKDSHRRQCRRNRILRSLPTLASVRKLIFLDKISARGRSLVAVLSLQRSSCTAGPCNTMYYMWTALQHVGPNHLGLWWSAKGPAAGVGRLLLDHHLRHPLHVRARMGRQLALQEEM